MNKLQLSGILLLSLLYNQVKLQSQAKKGQIKQTTKNVFHISQMNLDRWYKKTTPKTYLLSYPRSGNMWIRYCIEYVTKRPTLEKRDVLIAKFNCPLGYWLDLGTRFEKEPIWKVHYESWMKRMGTFDPQQETLILIIRNFKEAITRNIGKPLDVDLLKKHNGRFDAPYVYFDNMKLYETWHPDRRVLLYYEDLITQPRKTIQKLLTFLKEEATYLDAFMAHYNKHKQLCLDIYANHEDKPITKGNKTIYHSNAIDKDECKALDDYIAKTYPVIWEKYLKRYAETGRLG